MLFDTFELNYAGKDDVKNIMLNVILNRRWVKMEIDLGASCTMFNMDLGCNNGKPNLNRADVILHIWLTEQLKAEHLVYLSRLTGDVGLKLRGYL